MSSLDDLLNRAALSVAHPTAAQQNILDKIQHLRERLNESLLRVAVLGQFKRGKSTLLNALLGAALLPTGITPVTAIPTFVRFGPQTRARVSFLDARPPLTCAEDIPHFLERYVSETKNPDNQLRVASVELEVDSPFLKQNILLVDTPGVGSTFLHNTRSAEAVLAECDSAVFVVSADPPVTEVELEYLAKVERLIPKIFFALNKIDLLDPREREIAERFLAGVLEKQPSVARPVRIFRVSAKQALEAKRCGDRDALAASGLEELERVLAIELGREKSGILATTGQQRSIALVGELLFQSELERKARSLPEEILKQKVLTFEQSGARFENEKRAVSDLLSIDRKRLLEDLEKETDLLWKDAADRTKERVAHLVAQQIDINDARGQIATMLSEYFEEAFLRLVSLFRGKLSDKLAAHGDRAGAVINLVRQTAADLMEIRSPPPPPERTFEVMREPYWVPPEPTDSIIGISAGVLSRLLPNSTQQRRQRRQLLTDAEAAVLRNVANLNWAIRQNIENTCRQFEFSFGNQMTEAFAATLEAMQLAIARRKARAEEIESSMRDVVETIRSLSSVLNELRMFNRS